MDTIKIALMGGGGVGKSCIVFRYTQDEFIDKYDPTIEDLYKTGIEMMGKIYKVEITDTAGTGQFIAMRDVYIKNSDGFVLVYAIDDRGSFDEISEIWDQIKKIRNNYSDDKIPFILCGSKSDMEEKRMVSTVEGNKLANEWGCKFIEVSSKTSTNIHKCFDSILYEIVVHKLDIDSKLRNERRCNCIIL